jgi:hypothetical protein
MYTGAMLWRVGGKSGNEITLISKYYPAIRQFRLPAVASDPYFRNAGRYGSYVNAGITFPSSDIRVWLNNDNTGVGESDLPTTRKFLENFSKSERDVVQKQRTVDSNGEGISDVSNDEDGDYFWLLSGAEAQSGWFPNVPDRILTGLPGSTSADLPLRWLTRTKSSSPGGSSVVFVNESGVPEQTKSNTILHSAPIRPAFKLKASSVFLTSAAGAKDGEQGPQLKAATAPSGGVKLTIINDDFSLGSVIPTSIVGWNVKFNYSGATPSKNLSAVVSDAAGTGIKHYGNLHLVTLSGSGEASVAVPRDFVISPYGDDKLGFFAEEINAGNKTDVASKPIAMTVSGTPVTFTRQSVSAPTTPQGGQNKITGVTDAMAYKASSADDGAWKSITGTTVSDIPAGSYEVCYNGRISGSTINLPSDAKQVTVTGASDDPPGDGGGGGGGGCEVGAGAIGLLAAAFALLMRKRG